MKVENNKLSDKETFHSVNGLKELLKILGPGSKPIKNCL
jgi:hypothetical protein